MLPDTTPPHMCVLVGVGGVIRWCIYTLSLPSPCPFIAFKEAALGFGITSFLCLPLSSNSQSIDQLPGPFTTPTTANTHFSPDSRHHRLHYPPPMSRISKTTPPSQQLLGPCASLKNDNQQHQNNNQRHDNAHTLILAPAPFHDPPHLSLRSIQPRSVTIRHPLALVEHHDLGIELVAYLHAELSLPGDRFPQGV